MSTVNAAFAALCKAGDVDPSEVKFVRIDTRRRSVQFVTARGVQRAELDAAKPTAKKTTAAKRPAKKAAKV